MNVLKFGGTSVGSPESILNVKQIVSSRQESVIVVVSALGGVTDMLLRTSAQAERGDKDFRASYENIRKRHIDLVNAVFEPSRTSLPAARPCSASDSISPATK